MKYLPCLALFLILFTGCGKNDSKPCNYVKAGTDLRFRILDVNAHDMLRNGSLHKDSLIAWQPCRTDSLINSFASYRLPGSTDTGVILRFTNLRTPDYGEQGECYRVFFRWNYADVDTVDWHYRVEESSGCPLQIIDYISYNGIQAIHRNDNAYEYYEFLK